MNFAANLFYFKGVNMIKKFKKQSAVFVFFILIIALAANGCSRDDIPFIGNSEKSEKALEVYTEAVENLKNEDNFNLKLTTSVELKEMNCSVSLLNSILKKVVDHRLGKIDDEVIEYSFKNGVLTTDNTIVPKNVVQPVNSDINEYFFDGITSSYIVENDGAHDIYFTIGEEAASVDEIMNVFEEIKDEVGVDFSGYDIHEEYPEIDALAKNHSNFIDLMSVGPRIRSLMELNNNHEHSKDDPEPDYGDFGKTTKIENGTCHIGETLVIAHIDEKDRLSSVTFSSPFSIDVNATVFSNSFKTVVKFGISQTYEYSYAD